MAAKETDKMGRKRVECLLCGEFFHALAPHLGRKHSMSVEQYLGWCAEQGVKEPMTISAFASSKIDATRKARKRARPNTETEASAPGTAAAAPVEDKSVEVLDFGGFEIGVRSLKAIPERARAHIPAHDEKWEPDAELLARLAEAVEFDDVAMLVGPTGAGKTSLVAELAAMLNMPMVRIQCDGSTSYGKLFGKEKVGRDPATGEKGMYFKRGIIPTAGVTGAFIVIDEADALNPDVRISLHECLEKDALGRRKCTLEVGDDIAEVVWFHPATRFFLTGNNLGSDSDGLYGGTDGAPNLAFLDRCVRIPITYPDRAAITEICQSKSGLDRPSCKRIADAVHEILAMHTQSGLPWVLSVRTAIRLAVRMRVYQERGLERAVAIEHGILDQIPVAELREDVKGILQRVGLTA